MCVVIVLFLCLRTIGTSMRIFHENQKNDNGSKTLPNKFIEMFAATKQCIILVSKETRFCFCWLSSLDFDQNTISVLNQNTKSRSLKNSKIINPYYTINHLMSLICAAMLLLKCWQVLNIGLNIVFEVMIHIEREREISNEH